MPEDFLIGSSTGDHRQQSWARIFAPILARAKYISAA
jgi:hypothetical protein